MASWVGVLRLQAIITGIVCASSVALAAPGGAEEAERGPSATREMARGTDLTRGIAFVLAPDWDVVYRHALRRIRDDVRAALDADGVRYDNLRIGGGTIRFRVAEPSAQVRARASVMRAAEESKLTTAASMPGLAVQATSGGDFGVQLTGFGLAALQDGFLAAARQEINRRLSGGGFGDYLLTGEGGRLRVEIPPMAGTARAGRQC